MLRAHISSIDGKDHHIEPFGWRWWRINALWRHLIIWVAKIENKNKCMNKMFGSTWLDLKIYVTCIGVCWKVGSPPNDLKWKTPKRGYSWKRKNRVPYLGLTARNKEEWVLSCTTESKTLARCSSRWPPNKRSPFLSPPPSKSPTS